MQLPTIKFNDINPALELGFDLPGDKSISHRSIIAACIVSGTTKIYGLQRGADCLATINIFRKLGCEINLDHPQYAEVSSKGWRSFDQTKLHKLDAKNSGTTARLLLGLFSCIPGLKVEISGDASLSLRPMGRVVKLLQNTGADIQYLGQDGFLPVRISGKKITAGHHSFDRASAQVKSAILLASTSGAKQSLTLPLGARDHTELLLPYLGYQVEVHQKDLETVSAVAKNSLTCLPAYRVPADPSAMIFWLIVLPKLSQQTKMTFKNVLKNPTRTHYLKTLEQLGFHYQWECVETRHGESYGDIHFTYHNQLGSREVLVDGKWCIDEVPALASIAAVAGKALLFQNVEELKVKESDRLHKTIELVELFGADAHYRDKELRVKGHPLMKSDAIFNAAGDHRLVMSYVMLCFAAKCKNKVDSLGAHKVSYPHFLSELIKLGVTID